MPRPKTRTVLALVIAAATAVPAAARGSEPAIEQVLPRMVKIFGAGGYQNLYAYSTGYLVSSEGHVVTVWSHVLDTDNLTVVLDNGRRFEATFLGAEPPLDLAVLKLQADTLSLPHFDLSDIATAEPGTRVLAFSNMFKVATGDEPVSVLHGVIAARTRLSARRGAFEVAYDGPVYVVDAITNNPGAGGGVVTTFDGRPLGMIGKQLRNAETNTWLNYAIPLGELRESIEQIISGNFESSPQLADDEANPYRFRPLDFGLVMVPDVVHRTPAYIDSVVDGSPAERAGLQPDDLVLFANDELVQSNRMLKSILGRLEAGDMLGLIVRRGGRLVTVELPVEKTNAQ